MKVFWLLIMSAYIVSIMWCPFLYGQVDSRDKEKESRLWGELQKLAPNAVGSFRFATVALDRGNYAEAAYLYAQVATVAPTFDAALRRQGIALVHLGRAPEGLLLLDSALAKKRSPENLLALAYYLLYSDTGNTLLFNGMPERQGVSVNTAASVKQEVLLLKERLGTLTEKESFLLSVEKFRPSWQLLSSDTAKKHAVERAWMLAREAVTINVDNDIAYPVLLAQVALLNRQEQDVRNAAAILQVKYAGTLPTKYYSALLLALDRQWMEASEELEQAKAMGLPETIASQILDTGIRTHVLVRHIIHYCSYFVAVWVFCLVCLLGCGFVFSSLAVADVRRLLAGETIGWGGENTNKLYKLCITVLGDFYYISLIVASSLLVLFALAFTCVFFFLHSTQISMFIAVNLFLLFQAVQMVRMVFVKIEADESGIVISEEDAPKLWALVREIAAHMGTRPIDIIRITTGTELAVYEKGKTHKSSTRVLILGAGVLHGFGTNAFRSVLAHEYGHFLHRDIAGGDRALHVQVDMMKFSHAITESGLAVWWNIGFQFFRVYHFVFRRISRGATRLQEVLADRAAVYQYGASAFEEGLYHVIVQSTVFTFLANREIASAWEEKRAPKNLYELYLSVDDAEMNAAIECRVQEVLHSTTTNDDTHPCPVDRFRFAQRVQSQPQREIPGFVWDLFANRSALIDEVNIIIAHRLQELLADDASI